MLFQLSSDMLFFIFLLIEVTKKNWEELIMLFTKLPW